MDKSLMSSKSLMGRLYNWKFEQAKDYLKDADDNLKTAVLMLSNMFDDCGWFEGEVGCFVSKVVDELLSEHPDYDKVLKMLKGLNDLMVSFDGVC